MMKEMDWTTEGTTVEFSWRGWGKP